MSKLLVGAEEVMSLIPDSQVELSDFIEAELQGLSLDKRSKDFKLWKRNMDLLLSTYNKRAGFKAYCDVASIV